MTRDEMLVKLMHTDTGKTNTPNDDQKAFLARLVDEILLPLQEGIGDFTITSGFRSQEVVDALTQAGHPTAKNHSEHMDGRAADLQPHSVDLEDAFIWVKNQHGFDFGQLIQEQDIHGVKWLHVSLTRDNKPNRMCMTYDNGSYRIA